MTPCASTHADKGRGSLTDTLRGDGVGVLTLPLLFRGVTLGEADGVVLLDEDLARGGFPGAANGGLLRPAAGDTLRSGEALLEESGEVKFCLFGSGEDGGLGDLDRGRTACIGWPLQSTRGMAYSSSSGSMCDEPFGIDIDKVESSSVRGLADSLTDICLGEWTDALLLLLSDLALTANTDARLGDTGRFLATGLDGDEL